MLLSAHTHVHAQGRRELQALGIPFRVGGAAGVGDGGGVPAGLTDVLAEVGQEAAPHDLRVRQAREDAASIVELWRSCGVHRGRGGRRRHSRPGGPRRRRGSSPAGAQKESTRGLLRPRQLAAPTPCVPFRESCRGPFGALRAARPAGSGHACSARGAAVRWLLTTRAFCWGLASSRPMSSASTCRVVTITTSSLMGCGERHVAASFTGTMTSLRGTAPGLTPCRTTPVRIGTTFCAHLARLVERALAAGHRNPPHHELHVA